MTPRQTCPRPNGFGRNLRSKTRWFTGFCNSHQVSHFATFFIDARAEISVAESRFAHVKDATPPRLRVAGFGARSVRFVFPWRVPRRCLLLAEGGHEARPDGPRSRDPRGGEEEGARKGGGSPPHASPLRALLRYGFAGRSCGARQ